MKRLYIVRHGESEMNVRGLLAGGVTETPLTARGREQARSAGNGAKDLHIDYIISSPQSRAHQTAQEIASVIGYPEDKIELSSLLIERDFGSMEGQKYSPLLSADDAPGAETRDALKKRLTLAWERIQTIPAQNILVVTHGSAGRMLRNVTNPQIPYHSPHPSHHLPNAQLIQLI